MGIFIDRSTREQEESITANVREEEAVTNEGGNRREGEVSEDGRCSWATWAPPCLPAPIPTSVPSPETEDTAQTVGLVPRSVEGGNRREGEVSEVLS